MSPRRRRVDATKELADRAVRGRKAAASDVPGEHPRGPEQGADLVSFPARCPPRSHARAPERASAGLRHVEVLPPLPSSRSGGLAEATDGSGLVATVQWDAEARARSGATETKSEIEPSTV